MADHATPERATPEHATPGHAIPARPTPDDRIHDHASRDQPAPDRGDGDRSRLARGAFGEALAATHYERQGYRVLDRNWRTATGELDLVLRRGPVVVFSEVKARRTDAFGPPAAAVGVAKQRRIRLLALEWLRAHDTRCRELRFDVVSIVGTQVEVIESAF